MQDGTKYQFDFELLQRAKDDDPEAVMEMYHRFEPLLLSLCRGYRPIWDGTKQAYVHNDPPYHEAVEAAKVGFWRAVQDYEGGGPFHTMVRWRVSTALQQLRGESTAWGALKRQFHLLEYEYLSECGFRSARAASGLGEDEDGCTGYGAGDADKSPVEPEFAEMAALPDDSDKPRKNTGRGPLMRPVGHREPKSSDAARLRWRYRDAMMREAMRAVRLSETEFYIWAIELKIEGRRWRTQADAAMELHGDKRFQYKVARALSGIRERLAVELTQLGFDPNGELTSDEARKMENLMPIFIRPVVRPVMKVGARTYYEHFVDDRNLGPGPIYIDRPELHHYGQLDTMQQIDRDIIFAWGQAKGA